jgi:hypothetical protein
MILTAKEYVEGPECGGKVVYGDSVTGYTPCVVKTSGMISIEKIENIADKFGSGRWVKCLGDERGGKETCEIQGLDVWTSAGWTRMDRVIRHELASHKKIMRILTHTGVVDVTDEHSLIDENHHIINASFVNTGDLLLHNDLPMSHMQTDITLGKARIMGMFMGDGSGGCYNCPSGDKASWAINNSDYAMLEGYKSLCEEEYPQLSWSILPTLDSSGVYKLVPGSIIYGSVKAFIESYRNMLYDGKDKIVPTRILNASLAVKKAFWEGLYDADGDKDAHGYTRIDQDSQVSAATIYMLGAALGYNVSINTRNDKQTVYRLTLTMSAQRKAPNAIKKIDEVVGYNGYVYDLTTDNHEFAAGVGRMIVHNTDSIFIVFKNVDQETGEPLRGRDALASSIKQGQSASKGIKPHLPMPHNLEYEKTMFPLLLLSKKRYVGLLYEDDPDAKPKQKSMGIALKRRDYAPIVKQIYGGIIDIILKDRDIPKAVDFLKTRLRDLVEGRYDIADLIISKTLRGYYKIPYQIPHWVLAKRMHERDPGSAPQSNDRVPYVFVETSKRNALMGDRIEHADYVSKAIAAQKEGLKKPDVFVDTKLYIQNQIQKPCLQLLAIELEKLPGYVPRPELSMKEGLDDLVEAKGGNVRKARERLDTLREREVERLMFEPVLALPEIRQRDNRCNGQLDMHSFFRRDDEHDASDAFANKALPAPKAAPPAKNKKKDTVASKRIDSFFAARTS